LASQAELSHTRGASDHPITQGKAERRHKKMKNWILLESYFLRGDLDATIGDFGGV
jgi:hypothetical protein